MSVPDLPFVGQKYWGSPLNAGIEARTSSDYLADKLAEDGPFRSSLKSTIDTRVTDGLGSLDGAGTGTAGLAVLAASLPAEAREALDITIDTTVGTRVFMGGVMVYGDTGWRDLNAQLVNGWATHTGTQVRVLRTGREVFVIATALVHTAATSSHFVTLPSGFRPATNSTLPALGTGATVAWNGICHLNTTASQFAATFSTNDPWPTSLPGTPA